MFPHCFDFSPFQSPRFAHFPYSLIISHLSILDFDYGGTVMACKLLCLFSCYDLKRKKNESWRKLACVWSQEGRQVGGGMLERYSIVNRLANPENKNKKPIVELEIDCFFVCSRALSSCLCLPISFWPPFVVSLLQLSLCCAYLFSPA